MSNRFLNRREFLLAAGTAAGAIFLDKATSYAQQPGKPETTKIRLGYLPIVESAPLIIAQEKGFFAKYGMTEVEVVKQANWASARDNVVIGSEGGGIDGGMWQMPMPHLITEGVITNGRKVPMYVLAMLVTQGNGIAISKSLQGQGLHLRIKDPGVIKNFSSARGRKFKVAYTFPGGNQELWIRYWLAANGIDPDKDVDMVTIPPAETVQGMRTGTVDAFSTGDPWPYRIVEENAGFLGALTAQMWRFHPEEYLAIRADWVDKHPNATIALLRGIFDAQQWCDQRVNRAEMAKLLSGRNFFNVREDILIDPFLGQYDMGDGQAKVNDFTMGPLYWQDGRGSVSYPYKSHDLWFLIETMRWGLHRGFIKSVEQARALVDRVNREDIWRRAAQAAGIKPPASPSRGVETFFDGVRFDPANPQAYLNQLKIKRV
ncbi:MAG: CmpA/NrtA family ABC transporter substrate-binding protein [Pseudanabaenaceae cyanobacterium SKYGB_i_bin29]|nr:ABC transporter substrate-binding protein [Pseudanabaenaceae cyanobacterium SKYG29]MDW8422554.1 CmpA/NrtA family ABC transporter substrate-binding protein [Pseudanabaenaceae cyanobacterium SKYGB_i_bin29]